jgi:hypothetical protein
MTVCAALDPFRTGWTRKTGRHKESFPPAGERKKGLILTLALALTKAKLGENGNSQMQARLVLSALFIASFAPLAAAQQNQTQAQAAPPPAKAPKPAAPKPKPAAAKKPAPATIKARLIEKLGDWSVFVYEDGHGRVCFAAAAPADMQPRSAKRTAVVFYVTSWPKDGVRNEVSVKLGYKINANSTASVTAGGQRFALLPASNGSSQSEELEDKAHTKDPADDRKLLAAMAAGGPMIVKATSAKGTATTDQYSLDGASAAVQKLQQTCP